MPDALSWMMEALSGNMQQAAPQLAASSGTAQSGPDQTLSVGVDLH